MQVSSLFGSGQGPNVTGDIAKIWIYTPPTIVGNARMTAWTNLTDKNPCSTANVSAGIFTLLTATPAASSYYVTWTGNNSSSLGDINFAPNGSSNPTPTDEYQFVIGTRDCGGGGCFDFSPFTVGYIRPSLLSAVPTPPSICSTVSSGNHLAEINLVNFATSITQLNTLDFTNANGAVTERQYRILANLEFATTSPFTPLYGVNISPTTAASPTITTTGPVANLPSITGASLPKLQFAGSISTNLEYTTGGVKILFTNSANNNYPNVSTLSVNTGVPSTTPTLYYRMAYIILNEALSGMTSCIQTFYSNPGSITLSPDSGTPSSTIVCA